MLGFPLWIAPEQGPRSIDRVRYGGTVSEPQSQLRTILSTSKRVAAESLTQGLGEIYALTDAGGGVVQEGEQWKPHNVTNPVEGMNTLHNPQEMLVRRRAPGSFSRHPFSCEFRQPMIQIEYRGGLGCYRRRGRRWGSSWRGSLRTLRRRRATW